MSKTNLEQLFYSNTIWTQGINPQIKNITQNLFRHSAWYSSQSRTLQHVLNHTFGGYANPQKAFQTLYTMCALLKNNMPINIYPKYFTVDSNQATFLNDEFNTFLNFPTVSQQAFNLIIYHVPKGKSIIRPILDTQYEQNRLKQIETFCIENTQHFIRVYRNFKNSGLNTITIFTDQLHNSTIFTLWVFLPHLLGIEPKTAPEGQDLDKESVAYNKQVDSLFKIFNVLYTILTDSKTTDFITSDLTEIKDNLLTLTDEYAQQFDFVSGAISSFTKQLAKTKNQTAIAHFERELKYITSQITNYERSLTEFYVNKSKYEKLLIATRNTTEKDLEPFMQLLRNTKAIEILNTTDTEMILRVTAPLQYFQSSDFEAYENNPRSVYNTSFVDNPTLKNILHKVFVTREYKLVAQAIIHMCIQSNYNNTPLVFHAEQSPRSDNLTEFPNPHLYHYDCWGAAKTEMNKNICEENYELVVMQMIAAVQSVNIAENASFINGLLMDVKSNSRLKSLLTFTVNTPEGTRNFKLNELIEYDQIQEKQKTLKEAEQKIAQTPEKYTQVEIPDDDANWEDVGE